MASLLGKLTAYARTPAGQRVIRTAAQKAKEVTKDPKMKARLAELRQRASRRGRRPPTGSGTDAELL